MSQDEKHEEEVRPFGGYMYTTVTDEHGRTRWVEDRSRPYFTPGEGREITPATTATTATTAATETPAAPATSRPTIGSWRIWKQTDQQPGTTPRLETMSHEQRSDWFGREYADDLDTCQRVWEYLTGWIARAFDGCHAELTPGLTGCVLIEHTLKWAHDEEQPYRYCTLPESLARLVAATTTPHRMELLTQSGTKLNHYVMYDARVSYAAHLRSLPIITEDGVQHDAEPVYERYRPGRYRVRVTVPAGWSHIGLARRAGPGKRQWEYPATPGDEWETWLEEPELRLLDDNGIAPWPYKVLERMLYAPKNTRGKDPLENFCKVVFPEVERVEQAREKTPARMAYRHALRAILTQPVGLWHRGARGSRRPIDNIFDVREGEELENARDGSGLVAVSYEPLQGPVARWRRPEWSATVYGYEHVTATKRALQLPRAGILAIQGDALHLADCDPGWVDTGKIGCYRRKVDVMLARPRRVPDTTLNDLLRFERDIARASEGAR